MAAVRALPSPEKTVRIRELLKAGVPTRDITLEVFGEIRAEYTFAVRSIAADPNSFHPDVDEVAVQRALMGDRGVWENLTHYERREVMLAIWARREAERDEDETEAAELRPLCRDYHYVRPHGMAPEWLTNLADAVGVSISRIVDDARGFSRARVL